MRLDHDLLTIASQLFGFEGAHDSLDTLVFDNVNTADLIHIVAVFFTNICSHLTLFLVDLIEDAIHDTGQILTEFSANFLHKDSAQIVSISREACVDVKCGIRGRNMMSVKQVELTDRLHTIVDQELIRSGCHN